MSSSGPAELEIPDSSYPTGLNAEQWLAAIVESSDDAIIGESLDGTIFSWNSGAERMFGYTAEEAIGQSVKALAWPGLEDQVADLLERIRRGERVEHILTIRRHKTGRKVLVSLSLSPIVGPDANIVGIAKIARDITSRVALEESLVAREEQLRLVTEREAVTRAEAIANARFRDLILDSPDGILQVSEDGTILVANRAAERMFGYAEAELVGSSVDRLTPLALDGTHADLRRSFGGQDQAREMGHSLDVYARRKDGSEFPVEISLNPCRKETGLEVTALIRDITARRQTEQQVRTLQESYMAELVTQQKEQARLSQLKSEFVSGLTHDIRAAVHTIVGFADLMSEGAAGPLTTTQREFIGHISRDSRHLLALVSDVLELNRIEAGCLSVNLQCLSIHAATIEAVGAVQPHAAAQSIALRYCCGPDAEVMADPTRLRQILDNLLSNAVKFTPAGGEITVEAALEPEQVRVSVSDNGVGIPEDEQQRIFERFYQGRHAKGGSGLGLAITKQLVEMQGGVLTFASTPGRGSMFSFTLKRPPA